MKKVFTESARVSLLIALIIVLGILVHEAFFVIGLLIALIAFGEAMFHLLEGPVHHGRPAHRHP